jgi:hypothetical protein
MWLTSNQSRGRPQNAVMQRSGSRFVPTFGVALAVTLALTGCDQFKADPIAFTRVGESTVIRVCLDLTVSGIEIEQNNSLAWNAAGEASLPAGAEFSFSELPAGMVSSFFPFEEAMLDDANVRMTVSHDVGGSWSTFTPLDPGTLEEGVWLDGHGNPTASPCTPEECQPGFACHNDWPQPTGRPTELDPTFVPEPTPAPTE